MDLQLQGGGGALHETQSEDMIKEKEDGKKCELVWRRSEPDQRMIRVE